jgi:hypothetical protein
LPCGTRNCFKFPIFAAACSGGCSRFEVDLSLGSLIYRFRVKYGRGLRVAWYRDVIRPRILHTPPVEGLDDRRCEIHVLTSQQDWLNLIWALKSFYAASGRKYELCIHDDGSLESPAREQLLRHFPDARLIDRPTADSEVLPTLEKFPRCRAFRTTNQLAPKLFDFRHFLRADRMLLLDSDVLFFESPTELLRRIEDPTYRRNSVNTDVQSGYTVDPIAAGQRFGMSIPERFNSGLGVIHGDSLRLEWIEEFLDFPGILGHFWRIEQTLFALCSARYGVELLPAEYRVSLDRGVEGCVAKHYVGAVRHLMYGEGIRKLTREGRIAHAAAHGINPPAAASCSAASCSASA